MTLKYASQLQVKDMFFFKDEDFFRTNFLTEEIDMVLTYDEEKNLIPPTEPPYDSMRYILVAKRDIPAVATTILVMCALPAEQEAEWPARKDCFSMLLVCRSDTTVCTIDARKESNLWPLAIEYFTSPIIYEEMDNMLPPTIQHAMENFFGVSRGGFHDLQVQVSFHCTEVITDIYHYITKNNIEMIMFDGDLLDGFLGVDLDSLGDVELEYRDDIDEDDDRDDYGGLPPASWDPFNGDDD